MKKLLLLILLFCFAIYTRPVFAQNNSFVSIVNPVRGNDFWELKDQKPQTAVLGQIEILNKANLPATWLIRFDALNNREITDAIKNRSVDEKGLFLEVTPTWANQAGVKYRQSASWHAAGSAFLTGYERAEREKLIDAAFEKFKSMFGAFPLSVGAWWIDSYSLSYMKEKYGIVAALICADQYSTDNYQIWGQYFGTPYYPAKNNALHPAGSTENKLDIVLMQWAARDPVNGYGNGVNESTFSVQANDYIDYHNLDTRYFSALVDIYTKQQFNRFAHLVIGLENSYPWKEYESEYRKQTETLSDKLLVVSTMKNFADWYKRTFPELSPEHIIIANDPLGSYKRAVWFMNPYYRVGWFLNQDGSLFRDIRQYIDGEEELCYKSRCDNVNFATFATRVLDDVTYGSKWVLDEGGVNDFEIIKKTNSFLISYVNDAGNERKIEFLPRDIKVDEKIFTIDGAILNVVKQDSLIQKNDVPTKDILFKWSFSSVFLKSIVMILFLAIAVFIPGFVLTGKLYEKNNGMLKKIFVSTITGLVSLTLISYIAGLLQIKLLPYTYIIILMFLFFWLKLFRKLNFNLRIDKFAFISVIIITAGVIFLAIPTFRSGLIFPFGMGFWGPNTHDGIWHISLIKEIIKGLPAGNPVFSGEILKNYHFFYDLLIAETYNLTQVPVLDLVFRFYPLIFAILLGAGTYCLTLNIFGSKLQGKIAAIFSIYFVYFAGSFGWIADYLKNKTFGGESAFWANQSISFNLNPPFAVSLLIIIAFLLILLSAEKINRISVISILVLLGGSLIGFKVYAAVLLIGTLIPFAVVYSFKKQFALLYITVLSAGLSGLIFLSNFEPRQQLIMFAPFWFIHAMVDSESRLGWARLSLARVAGWETQNWFKLAIAEVVGLVLFIAGNLGLRIVSFASIRKFPVILIFSALSFLIPIIFIQAGNPWNTIQFFYYGLYMTALVSGVVLSSLILRVNKFLAIIITFILVIVAPVNSVTTASYYLGSPHAIISNGELEALEFLSKQPDGIVLTIPYDDKLKRKFGEPWPLIAYDSTAYVAALSGKAVFIEDEPQNQILLTNYKKRLISSRNFFQNVVFAKTKFLKENKIEYIYLPKVYNFYLDEKEIFAKNIFENEEIKIYRLI